MKILITGATGFVGKTLIPFLFQKGISDIAIIVRSKKKSSKLFGSLPISIIEIDCYLEENIISFSPSITLHMATLFTTKRDRETASNIIDSNITFGTNILEALSKTNCEYFVNIGTFTEYFQVTGEYKPNNLYSASKTAFRSIVQYYQSISSFKWVNVVIYSPYGRINENKKVIDHMINALDSSNSINFSLGEQILDFIHVDDIADFFYNLLIKIYKCKDDYIQFHLGTGVGHSLRDVAKTIESVFSKKLNAKWGGLPYNEFEPMHAVAPISKNLKILNWKPKLTLEKGLIILKKDLKSS